MKIVDNCTLPKTKFKDIKYGEVFKTQRAIYMKVPEFGVVRNNNMPIIPANAIELCEGEAACFNFNWFNDDFDVIAIDAELVLKKQGC